MLVQAYAHHMFACLLRVGDGTYMHRHKTRDVRISRAPQAIQRDMVAWQGRGTQDVGRGVPNVGRKGCGTRDVVRGTLDAGRNAGSMMVCRLFGNHLKRRMLQNSSGVICAAPLQRWALAFFSSFAKRVLFDDDFGLYIPQMTIKTSGQPQRGDNGHAQHAHEDARSTRTHRHEDQHEHLNVQQVRICCFRARAARYIFALQTFIVNCAYGSNVRKGHRTPQQQ